MPGVCRPAGTAGERRLQRHKEITQSYQWCCFAYEGGAGWRGTIYLPLHDGNLNFFKTYTVILIKILSLSRARGATNAGRRVIVTVSKILVRQWKRPEGI